MKLTKEKLQEMYNTKTNEECCASLGVSKATFLKYVKEAGIPLNAVPAYKNSPRSGNTAPGTSPVRRTASSG